MSSPMSVQSSRSFSDTLPTKKHSSSQFKRAIFSSLRVKRTTERPRIGDLFESRWSLYSANSTSTDDFNWSLQPSYLKMMNDTNLMDNCAAAKEEIESIREQVSMRQSQFLETNKSETHRNTVDAQHWLQWIIYMEKYLEAFSPTWKQVNQMDEMERNASFNEQCDLRQYIASHNRIFNQMIKEQNSERIRKVQEKYHMLLLNAIEKQCLLEEYSNHADNAEPSDYDCSADVNLDVYKLCDIDIEPQHTIDQLDYTLIRSDESLSSNSDADTIITSDDGINFPTHPTTSKSSLFSEDQCSPFSSHLDVQNEERQSWENIMKELDEGNVASSTSELQKNRKTSSSSISESTLKLIKNVDSVMPRAPTPNLDEYLNTNSKVDDWLFNHPNEPFNSTNKKLADVDKKSGHKICSSSSDSDRGSTLSIQWDNFQDIYTLTAPITIEPNNDFLYFGDDYDDALKSKRAGSYSSISDLIKSSTSAATTPSKSEKSVQNYHKTKDEIIVPPNETKMVCRKKKRVSRKLTKKTDSVIEQSALDDSSKLARDVLLVVEDLRNNYMNLKPHDFDGILKICRENLGCLIVVLDKEQRSHYRSNESVKSVGDDRIYIQESCKCGIIGRFFARIVRFLYECSRKVRKSFICRFLFKILKHFYAMVKFLSQKVRVYRSYYGTY